MKTLEERKQAVYKIIDAYGSLLERQKSKEYQERRETLIVSRKNIEKERYQIALIGFIKRGKSTLLNALLGDPENPILSPVSVKTCTGAIVKYLDSALYPEREGKEGAIVYYNNGDKPKEIARDDFEKYVSQIKEGYNADESKNIDCVEVYGPFPFIKNRGIFVDTPGLGAIFDQDYLATNILSEVDIILCPLAIDNLLSAEERDYLNKFLAPQKEKLVFLITKVDEEKDKHKLADAVKKAGDLAAELVGGKPPIFQVSAKRLMRANQGKAFEEDMPVEDIEKAKEASGIAALEAYLDKQLKEKSNTDEKIRRFCKQLEAFFETDEKNWRENSEKLKLDAGELEQKKAALEKTTGDIKTSFNRNVKKFKQDWKNTVDLYIGKLEAKQGPIEQRLLRKKQSLMELVNHSSTLTRKIQAEVQAEFAPELSDMQEKLREITYEFAEKQKSDIENAFSLNPHYAKESGVEHEMSTWIGGGAAVGTGAAGVAVAANALGSMIAASGALATATTVASTTAATSGIFSTIAAWFGGGQIVATSTAVGVAQGAALAALIGGALPLLGGVVVAKAAFEFGKSFLQSKAQDKTSEVLAEHLKQVLTAIKEGSASGLDNFLKQFEAHLDTILEKEKDSLDATIEALKNLNADARLQENDKNLQELDRLAHELRALSNEL